MEESAPTPQESLDYLVNMAHACARLSRAVEAMSLTSNPSRALNVTRIIEEDRIRDLLKGGGSILPNTKYDVVPSEGFAGGLGEIRLDLNGQPYIILTNTN